MTQPYPFTYTVDTQHANASAAKRLRSNGLVLTNPIDSRLVGQPEVIQKRASGELLRWFPFAPDPFPAFLV